MDKGKRKIRKSTIIILPLYIIAILLIMNVTIKNNISINKINDKNIALSKKIKINKNKYKEIEKISNSTKEEINKYKNIDEEINNTKSKVFELAKEVENKIVNNQTSYKIAYITFDDGPYQLTEHVLNVLKEHKVKATFFNIGVGKTKCLDNSNMDCTEFYKKIVDNGHTLANHTYSHAIFDGLYKSSDSFISQVQKQHDYVYSKTNYSMNILRFPGGSASAGRLKESISNGLKNMGYGWVDWNAQDGDGKYLASNEQAWNTFTSSINENIEVVLLHDYNYITYSILPDIINYLEENNYIILPLFYDSVMVNK